MKILAEMYRSGKINIQGKTIFRNAVRGVILRGSDLLMIHSSVMGDYKFPGGGVQKGESHKQALAREIEEESGALLDLLGEGLGAVIEYDIPMETEYDVFKMTSYYYLCQVGAGFGQQRLDDYEKDLGFHPAWVNVDEAIFINRSLLNIDNPPQWLKRELLVLEYIRLNFFGPTGVHPSV